MMAHPPDDVHGASPTPGDDPFGTPLDAARALAGVEKWVIFPADNPDAGLQCTGAAQDCRAGECPAAKDAKARGKHPRVARWDLLTRDDVPDDGQLVAWFGGDTPDNLAVSCGPSGLLVIDDDVDGGLIAYAEVMGVEIPATFTVKTHQGHHYYFRQPEGREPLGNTAGWLHAFRCDVRGAGGYVIGPGSLHWSGDRYSVLDDAEPVEAPGWLIDAIERVGQGPPADPTEGVAGPRGGQAGEPGTALPTSGLARWDDAERYGTADKLVAQYRRHCREVIGQGDPYRKALFRAARDGWRLVNLGLLDEDEMHADMRAIILRCWPPDDPKVHRDRGGHPAPFDDPRDWRTIDAEARVTSKHSALRSPWVLLEGPPTRPGREFRSRLPDSPREPVTRDDTAEPESDARTTDGKRPVTDARDTTQPIDTSLSMIEPPPVTGDPELDNEIRNIWLRQSARDVLDARRRPVLSRKTARALMSAARPRYLVERMLYRDGLAVLFGAPGAGKSYVALDIALCLVTGKPWRGTVLLGKNGGLGKVHYVMAEGQATNGARMAAWAFHRECTDVDMDNIDRGFIVYDEGIPLTEMGVQKYIEHVKEDSPDIIVLDTKNLMFMGKESQGEDYGAMLRVLHMIRRAADRCAVILIDHSGLKDKERVRGSNAQIGGVDTEIMCELEEGTGLRVVTMTRDKNAGLGELEWLFRLEQCEGAPREPGEPVPAVLIEATRDGHKPLPVDGPDWAQDRLPDPIVELIDGAKDKNGESRHGKRDAKDMVRALRRVGAGEEHTIDQIRAMIAAHPRHRQLAAERGGPQPPIVSARAAVKLLVDLGILARVANAPTRRVLMSRYTAEEMPS
jgi:hypothetical protein